MHRNTIFSAAIILLSAFGANAVAAQTAPAPCTTETVAEGSATGRSERRFTTKCPGQEATTTMISFTPQGPSPTGEDASHTKPTKTPLARR